MANDELYRFPDTPPVFPAAVAGTFTRGSSLRVRAAVLGLGVVPRLALLETAQVTRPTRLTNSHTTATAM